MSITRRFKLTELLVLQGSLAFDKLANGGQQKPKGADKIKVTSVSGIPGPGDLVL